MEPHTLSLEQLGQVHESQVFVSLLSFLAFQIYPEFIETFYLNVTMFS